MEIATIGVLIGLTDNLITVVQKLLKATGSGGLFGRRAAGKEDLSALAKTFSEYQARLEYLADQLEQSETLTRMVPSWLMLADRMPFWEDVTAMEDSEIRSVEHDIRSLIDMSIGDHFSAAFFAKNYDKLPEMGTNIAIFRANLQNLNRTLSSITPGSTGVFRGQWQTLTTQFNDTRNSANDIRYSAEDIQGKLIRELKDAAQKTVP